ncbi:hypothetical protein F4780DRAFT_740246 [Xylariomycetidae sp. FL0641]|nr:hypothetical protein F4780DRAFT_740246 [Xylariomycetidae sp. FL0641]
MAVSVNEDRIMKLRKQIDSQCIQLGSPSQRVPRGVGYVVYSRATEMQGGGNCPKRHTHYKNLKEHVKWEHLDLVCLWAPTFTSALDSCPRLPRPRRTVSPQPAKPPPRGPDSTLSDTTFSGASSCHRDREYACPSRMAWLACCLQTIGTSSGSPRLRRHAFELLDQPILRVTTVAFPSSDQVKAATNGATRGPRPPTQTLDVPQGARASISVPRASTSASRFPTTELSSVNLGPRSEAIGLLATPLTKGAARWHRDQEVLLPQTPGHLPKELGKEYVVLTFPIFFFFFSFFSFFSFFLHF